MNTLDIIYVIGIMAPFVALSLYFAYVAAFSS